MSDVAIAADTTDEAIATDKVHGKANDANDKAIDSDDSNDADDANEVDNANEANEADEADDANEVDEAGVSIEMPLLLPFSLIKYPATFAEVKGSFGVNNNQLLGFDVAV